VTIPATRIRTPGLSSTHKWIVRLMVFPLQLCAINQKASERL
jgi:hypothetical protein